MTTLQSSIQECFQGISEPRVKNRSKYDLTSILVIGLLATVAGADSFNDIELFARSKKEWLSTFLDLPNRVPSHDTFNRVFSLILPEEFNRCFIRWTQAISDKIEGVVAIDGKTLRRSFESASEPMGLHMVSAWACENQLVLGQVRTAAKSNEITAIPHLISILDLKETIVTIDAIGCQKDIAKGILNAEADYVLSLKGNQKNTYERAKSLFEEQNQSEFENLSCSFFSSTEKNRGRLETREVSSIDVSETEYFKTWSDLKSITKIVSTRTLKDRKTKTETRYYISSLSANAEQIGKVIRSHWGIENKLHWVLDVAFKEDYARNRKDHSAENVAILRRMAMNMIKKENSSKTSLRGKRLKASWDDDYLIHLLSIKLDKEF